MTGILSPRCVPETSRGGKERDYISFSALRTYQTCPLKYFFKYVAQLPEESIASTLIFGTAMHRALEYHFRVLQGGHGPPCVEELVEEYHAGWVERGQTRVRFGKEETRQDLDEVARRMLKAFSCSSSAIPIGRIVAVEETLRGVVIPGLPDLLGRVDLILETDAELIISDWKTARSRWSAEQFRDASEQLLLYAELAQNLAPGKIVRLEFVVLTKTREVALDRHSGVVDRSQAERMKRVVERVWHAITAEHFYPAPSPMNCPGCPFRQPCEQWSG